MIYVIIVIVFVLAEYKMKNYIEKNRGLGERQEILNGKIIIRKFYNKGAFLSFMENKKEIVKSVSGIFLGLLVFLFAIALPKKGNKLYKLGLALMLSGAISNVTDRFSRGYVIDYFTINYKKLKTIIFNLADMAIFLGTFLLILSYLASGIIKRGSDKTLK